MKSKYDAREPLNSVHSTNAATDDYVYTEQLLPKEPTNYNEKKAKPLVILMWCVAAVITNVAQAVTLKKSGDRFKTGPYFIFWFTCIPFVIAYWAMLLGTWFFTTEITKEMRRTPMYKFVIVGILTTLNGVAMIFANSHVSGLLQALLGPTIITIPLSMIFSFFLLKRTYKIGQIIAAFLIISGVLVAVLPAVLTAHEEAHDSAGWALCFLLGSVPLTLANVYEEKAFEESPIHITYMLAWSVWWQFLSILACAPLDIIPGFGESTASTFFSHQLDSVNCFFNIGGAVDCEGAWVPVTLFIIAYISTNFAMLGVIKNGSAVFAFICTTLVTPLTEFCFAIPFIMGKDVEKLQWYHGVSLAILLVGVGLYRYVEVKRTNALGMGEVGIVTTSPGYFTLPAQMTVAEDTSARVRYRKSRQHWTI